MIPTPKAVLRQPVYRPLLDVLDGHFMTSQELAERWRYTDDHLSNLRRGGKGPPYTKLMNGAIRYRVADVIEAELAGSAGPVSLDEILLAVSACASVPAEARVTIIEHLRGAFRASGPKPAAGTA